MKMISVMLVLVSVKAFACMSAVSKAEAFTVNIPGQQVVTLRVNDSGVQSSVLKIHQYAQAPQVTYDENLLTKVDAGDGFISLVPSKEGETDTVVSIKGEDGTVHAQKVHIIYKYGSKCMAPSGL